ncbi:hypothetical protein HMPREF1142_0602 [Peptostreptococcaceae bacterium AS15]|nr:hypothetical protein HMPREF1142_0602 [Peptostreptococcaceae bacterium AS15]
MELFLFGILGIVIIFVLQELASYILNKVFVAAENKIPSIYKYIKKQRIEKFYSIKNSDDYKEFELAYLKEYYGEELFTKIGNKCIPVFSVKYRGDEKGLKILKIRDYDKLGNKLGVEFSFNPNDHQNYKKYKYYKSYYNIVGDKIKFPDRPGIMLDKIICNSEGEMEQFKGCIGTYAENVYSNHILEYELYKLYRLYCKSNKKNIRELCNKSEIRNKIHTSVYCESSDSKLNLMKKSLCTGEGRKSLLSVQMLVLIKKGGDYFIKITQRSKEVAVAPGRFQLVPSGGFEVLNDSITGYSKFEIEDNYSAGCSIFREYLEEIFGEEEFEGKGVGSVNEALLKDERIIKIEKMLKDKRAEFAFLGSVIDLAGLRHELSFVLVIHDEEYNKNKFIGNEESTNRTFIPNVTLSNFESHEDIWKNLHGPSAAMWMLFKETDIYIKLLKNKENHCK